MLLSETEGNVLDNANLSSSLLELRKELGKSDDRVSGMKDMKKDMKTASLQYLSAAQHATILYETIQHLRCINPMYQYSFDWFTKVFRSSIENSNKSNNIEKRLRYLKDHLTYSLFCQVSYSLQDEDGLIFAFLLCCKLMIKENKVPAQGLAMLIKLWKVVTTEDIASSNDNDKSKEVLPPGLDWLGQSAWDFLHEYSSHFPEMKGLCNDFVDSNARWKLLYEAKEPDNLPLHEPWYSRLGRFHKLVIVATLRMDKLHELVYSFVSDHIGYKFVEPVQFDLGRIFSECDPSQPLVYTVQGPNEAVEDICRFAKEREKSLIQLSMGVEDEAWVKETVLSTLETGDKWVVLENFDNTRNIEEILRHHIKIDQDFHAGYRLWMITQPTYHFPVPELQQCLKLTSEPAGSIRCVSFGYIFQLRRAELCLASTTSAQPRSGLPCQYNACAAVVLVVIIRNQILYPSGKPSLRPSLEAASRKPNAGLETGSPSAEPKDTCPDCSTAWPSFMLHSMNGAPMEPLEAGPLAPPFPTMI